MTLAKYQNLWKLRRNGKILAISKEGERIVCSGQRLESKNAGNNSKLSTQLLAMLQIVDNVAELKNNPSTLQHYVQYFRCFSVLCGLMRSVSSTYCVGKLSWCKQFSKNSKVTIPNILGRPKILRISGSTMQWRSPEKCVTVCCLCSHCESRN